jgi:hypothetical protein
MELEQLRGGLRGRGIKTTFVSRGVMELEQLRGGLRGRDIKTAILAGN